MMGLLIKAEPRPAQRGHSAPGIIAGSITFFVGSASLHLMLFWAVQHQGTFESGIAESASRMVVHLVAESEPAAPLRLQTPETEMSSGAKASNDSINQPIRVPAKGFLPAGRLTRLPTPTTEIDLDVPGINDTTVVATVELTVLVDMHGAVVDVIIPSHPNRHVQAFAERVAGQFKNASFIPGEIAGVAVKSQLQVTVVSEGLQESNR